VNRDATHQALLSGLQGGGHQVVAPGVVRVDLDAPVGLGLPQPHAQNLLDVDAFPRADPGVHVDLQRVDAYVSAAVRGGHQAGDLQEHRGGLIRGPEVHPQLGAHGAVGLHLLAE